MIPYRFGTNRGRPRDRAGERSAVIVARAAAGNRSRLIRTVDGQRKEIRLKLDDLVNRGKLEYNVPMQPGDVKETYADTGRLARAVGFAPSTPLDEGLARFAGWYRRYYGFG